MASSELYLSVKNRLPPWFPNFDSPQRFANYTKSIYAALNQLEQYRLQMDKRFSREAALMNRNLNRYIDILPFDHNRIVIGNEGYINASAVNSIGNHKSYIAAQGPLTHTANDFWKMIWENSVQKIVMLTTLEENGREKCHKYWPDERQEYGSIIIENLKEEHQEDVVIRTFIASDSGSWRVVVMFQYLDWPDRKRSNALSVLKLIELVSTATVVTLPGQSMKTTNPPVVVHCSAGVGRTGTFCTIESVLHQMQISSTFPDFQFEENEIQSLPLDLVAYQINHFRKQRVLSVQSLAQVELCYEAILLKISLNKP